MEGYNIAIGFNDNIQIDTEHILVGSDFVTQATNWQRLVNAGSYCVLPTPTNKNNIITFKPSNNDYSIATHKPLLYFADVPKNFNSPVVLRSSSYADAITCNVFTVGKLNNIPKPNYGMMVYDGLGNVIYNSDCKVLKINEILEVNINSLPITLSHNAQNPYYIVPYMTKIWHSEGHYNPKVGLVEYNLKQYAIGIKKLSSTQISVSWFYYGLRLFETPYLTYNQGWIESYYTPFRIAVCNID